MHLTQQQLQRNIFINITSKMTYSPQETLSLIIHPTYIGSLKDWPNYATNDELIGLELIGQIYAGKGNKKIVYRLPNQKIMYETFESLLNRKKHYSLEEAQQNFRRKQLTTSYQFYHGGSLQKKVKPNIFEFKTLHKLNLSKPLNPIAVSFIDNWLSIPDRKQLESYVLCTLRSLNSKVQIADPHKTEMKTKYNGTEDWSLSKPVRMDKIGEELYAFKPNLAAIKRQEEKQRMLKAKLKQLEGSDFAKQMSIFKDFKIN